MTAPLSLAGQRFGRLVAIERGPNTPAGKGQWWCQCDCGGPRTLVVASGLKGGGVTSCRCSWLSGDKQSTHGHTRGRRFPPTYRSWTKMRSRCLSPRDKDYHHYGGRGITICEPWSSFETFLADMGEKPAGLTLDRIDVDGNYEPTNCRWASRAVQATNLRTSLKPATVIQLRADYAAGYSFAELGRRYNLTGTGARAIALRQTWRHI